MQRRTFILGAGGAAGLSLIGPALTRETARHGLLLSSGQHHADVAVDEWQEIVSGYGYSYQTTDPAVLLDSLVIDVLGIQYTIDYQQRRTANDSALRDLRRTSALLAALMAMTMANVGQIMHSERWWRSARRIAEQSGDIETVAWVRGREVVRAMYEQRPLDLILRLIDEAEVRAHGASSRALPELVGGKAQTLALIGRRDDALAALRQLEKIHSELPNEALTQQATVFTWFEAQMRFTESFVYSHLGDIKRATIAQEQALSAYPTTFRRGPAQIELQQALCLTRIGDTAEGIRLAQGVITSMSPTDYIRPIFDLGDRVLQAVPPAQRQIASVTEFRDCISTLHSSR